MILVGQTVLDLKGAPAEHCHSDDARPMPASENAPTEATLKEWVCMLPILRSVVTMNIRELHALARPGQLFSGNTRVNTKVVGLCVNNTFNRDRLPAGELAEATVHHSPLVTWRGRVTDFVMAVRQSEIEMH